MDKKHDILQPSGYDKEPVNSGSEIFADKKPIKTTGTTCYAFSARYESRHVFVKQLKPEHSSNPVYRSAFQKEYELGVSLRHPSIPQYIKFTDDTLITEFVDGKTLHQMIQENDPRLHSDSNIEKWVGQLLDVMDYLHARNVIHCDIKSDNIMITNDTRNLMLIDLDKAFTSSQDLTPGTPLNFGSEEENLTKRQMDIRGVRNIIEKLLQYVDSNSLKERIEKVVASAGSLEMTIPELLKIWKQPIQKQSEEKINSKRINAGWWIGSAIFIALIVIIWSYLPKETPEVIPSTSISLEWNSLLETDVVSMNMLLDEISDEIQKDKIKPDGVAKIVLLISDEMNSFDEKVMDKYSEKFPELGQLRLMEGIYESEPVRLMVERRDKILQLLLEIQQQPLPDKTKVSPRSYNIPSSNFEKELEIDLADYLSVLTQVEEVLDRFDDYPLDKINTKLKIQNLQTDFDHKLFIEYPEKFPSLSGIEIHDKAYKTPVIERMVKLRETVLARLDK